MFRDILAKIKAEKESKEQKKKEKTQKKKVKKKQVKRKKRTKRPQVEEEQQLLKIFELERMKKSVDKEKLIEKELRPQQIEKEIRPVKEKLEEEVIEKPLGKEEEQAIEKEIIPQQIKEDIQPIKEIPEEKVEKEVVKKTEQPRVEKELVQIPQKGKLQEEIEPIPISKKEETKVEEELIIEQKKIEINERDMIKMTEEKEEIPLIEFESDATAPILRYDLPSPSSYEGRNYIEINDIPIEKFKNDKDIIYKVKGYEEILTKNREEIRSYLSKITRAELEEDFYGLEIELAPEIDVDESQISFLNEQITKLENEITTLLSEKQAIIDGAAGKTGLEYAAYWVAGTIRCTAIDNTVKIKRNQIKGYKNTLASLQPDQAVTYPVKPIFPENVDNFQVRYQLFKYYLEVAITYKDLVPAFYKTLGNHLKIKFIKVEDLKPRLLFVETFRLTNFPGDYGAGTTIKTFSLLPRESTEISVKTWKKTEETMKKASSILDSYTEDTADEFEKSAQAECARSAKIDKTSSYNVKASANAGWGWGSASVSAGTEGSTSSSREASAKNVMSAASKHAQSSSAQREVNIDTEHERRVETEVETSMMRSIRNLNVTRTLNFTFRQMNQEYHSILHLVDLRLGFYNGYPGSFREYPLCDIVHFVNKYMNDPTTFLEEFKTIIKNEYMHVKDYRGESLALIEEVNDGLGTRPYLRVKPSLDKDGNPYGQQFYQMRPEKEKDGKLVQEADVRWVDGIILGTQTITMKTDGVIVEALMGKVNALDDYAYLYRTEKIMRKKMENNRIKEGLLLVKQLVEANKYNEAVLAYKQTFGVEPGIDVLKNLFTFKLESVKD